MTGAPVLQLDVRPMLADGGEPFDLIVSTAGRLPAGGTLELTAPFEPVPLYPVMRRRGFVRAAEARGPAEWVVRFRDSGITPTGTLSEIVTRVPATAAVFARYGLDLCCGGGKTLAFAAQAHGVNLDALLEALQSTWVQGTAR